ncbi:NAD(P)-dependent oxidoreductase [Mangrovibacterium marinum]|uniref:D-3-phosphoglycerate dehydrogenase n=1 Tax=Mangrovibacterium marinum TaxID=1639118 RepID=A0A2T5C432_9BACT|nr:NAD(P)-dependent oxidoreductase [Mangrovibacterium marinum]PTN09563.1 D-3-phosphoglycerate dehydrogenase [Mangrovibacterium marinum]
MKRVLIATEKPFASSAISQIADLLHKAGYSLNLLEKYSSKNELLDAASEVDALIVRSDQVDRELLDAAAKLKIVVRAGAGYDNVDTAYAKEKSVVVMNTPGQNSNAVAELAIGLAIYGIREFFGGKSGGELRGRTLGLHGYGYVARNVHRIARALGMKVLTYTRFSKAQATSEGLQVTGSLEELYAQSDVVSIHVPARGIHLKSVSMAVLKQLKKNAIIINTARKEVIDEEDLCAFMTQRDDVKYLSDLRPDCAAVFEEKFAGRYFFTPKKIGAQTQEANTNAGLAAARQIVAFFEEGDETFRVNK